MDWRGLVAGELRLTFDILFGLLIGFAVLRSGLADRLMRRLVPHLRKAGIGSELGMALTLSLGSAKAGAAFIASALDSGKLSERSAKWGTLLLSFPAYLHRWPSTMVMATSMAGVSGAIFGSILLLRSAARFVQVLFILKRGGAAKDIRFNKRLLKTLPIAWFFFAVAYMLVPWAESTIKEWLQAGTILPLAALTVAAASIAHVSAALALAGGSLAAGELTIAQAVFALLLGNSFGIVTRLFRANAGYYFGLFSREMAKQLLFWNFTTTAGFAVLSIALAALPLLF
ncbi:MAG: hypothetical protein LUH49_05030 [Cloacibacillus porcorum]|uniref:hypothetical protein n=1 Tax=Cloacibacillus porcorum TaxID=1197717 RepID=UPI0023F0342F|nr:hypothetical protein [Cloacibacillus porcorum]MCD7876318.1 hypothetical protein [Cloacibacillus porcorum]